MTSRGSVSFRCLSLYLAVVLLLLSACASGKTPSGAGSGLIGGLWSSEEIAQMKSLSLASLPPLPADPSNAYGDDARAANLGQRIFFDARFSANGEISCSTCHQPQRFFTDGKARAEAIGETQRGTPTIIGIAYSPWFFWDGRRDSQWSQALTPMESAVEHGGNRMHNARILYEDPAYRPAYEAIFGPLPDLSDDERFPLNAGPLENAEWSAAWEQIPAEDQEAVNRVFANIGKAVAAYERQIVPGPSRFDQYVDALVDGDFELAAGTMTADEIAGLSLFLNEGNCTQCHNGPLLTNNGFHSIGLPAVEDLAPDIGRFSGVQQALNDPFNCLGEYSDAAPEECLELRFAKTDGQELMAAFKVPTLRNVAETTPYMHSGQFATLSEVLDHYKRAPAGPTGHTDLFPLDLSERELQQLEAFLRTLSGPPDVSPQLLAPPG